MVDRPDTVESKSFAAFKRVRNLLRKFNGREIIHACVQQMMRPDADNVEQVRLYQPWLLLLLIKWTALHGEFTSPYRHSLTRADFDHFVKLMGEYEGTALLPSQYDDPYLFLKNIAFQQFWIQEPRPPAIPRQSTMFSGLPERHPFCESFRRETGVSIGEFIELSFVLLSAFMDAKNTFITEAWFAPIADNYAPGKIKNLLAALSLDFDELRRYFEGIARGNPCVARELYEQTPLKRYPLLRVHDKYYPYARGLLTESLKTFIYDVLRNQDPQSFMDKFGPIFEAYVGKCWTYSELAFVTEQQLRSSLPTSGKLVDYLVVDGETNVFVDAKAVEMAEQGKITHKVDIVRDKTKVSIIKAIKQAFATAKAIANLDTIGRMRIGHGNNYLIVVTFADLYVGSGREFYNRIAKETLDRIAMDYDRMQWIPFENMYFVTIDDLDLLVSCIKSGNINLGEFLQRTVNADASPQTMRLVLRQHIIEACPDAVPPQYLLDEAESIGQRIQARMIGGETAQQ